MLFLETDMIFIEASLSAKCGYVLCLPHTSTRSWLLMQGKHDDRMRALLQWVDDQHERDAPPDAVPLDASEFKISCVSSPSC